MNPGGNMIEFKCPYCGRLLRAADNIAGKTSSCHKCGGSIRIPF